MTEKNMIGGRCGCGQFKSASSPNCKKCEKGVRGIKNLVGAGGFGMLSSGVKKQRTSLFDRTTVDGPCAMEGTVVSVGGSTDMECKEEIASVGDDSTILAGGREKCLQMQSRNASCSCGIVDGSSLSSCSVMSHGQEGSISSWEMCEGSDASSLGDSLSMGLDDSDEDSEAEVLVEILEGGSDGEEFSWDSGASTEDESMEEECIGETVDELDEHPKCPSVVDYGLTVVEENGSFCANCHRSECRGFEGLLCYSVVLGSYRCRDIGFSIKKWRTFEKNDCTRGRVLLCRECFGLLSLKEQKKRKTAKKPVGWILVWAVYVWRFVSDESLYRRFGCGMLKFLPLQWHGCWKQELLKLFPGLLDELERLEADKTGCLCVDVTLKRSWLKKMNSDLALGMMKKVCNELMVPLCLCPWGCSSYYCEKGHCSFDAVMHRYFPFVPCTGTFCGTGAVAKLVSAREDFFGDADMHLYRPEWRVLPSVYFLDGVGPVFETCKEHDGGTLMKYFHQAKSDCILPSRFAESLSLAVFRSRTLRPTMPMKYSNGYRLQKCLATYCGVDTTYVNEQRFFDHTSHIEDLNEARAFAGRDDIKGLAANLKDSGALPGEYFDNLVKRSDSLYGSKNDCGAAAYGSTVMTLREAIKLQQLLSLSGVVEVEKNDGDPNRVSFRPNWPSALVFVHQNDGYGCKMFEIPMFRSSRSKKAPKTSCMMSFWFFCHCVCSLSELWEEVHYSVTSVESCQGFLLSFLTRTITRQNIARDKKRNPFYVPNAHHLMKPSHLFSLLLGEKEPTGRVPSEVFDLVRECCDESRVNIRCVGDGDEFSLERAVLEDEGGCTEDCQVLFIKGGAHKLQDRISVDGHTLELRFLAFSAGLQGCGRPNFWSGEVWRRHGGVFRHWWVTKRCPVTVTTIKEEKVSDGLLDKLLFSVYCKVEDAKECNYRRDYLKYIGGQNHIFCKIHDVPLITSLVFRKKTGRRCCSVINGGGCGRKEDICCPFEDCKVCICIICKNSCEKETVTFFQDTSEAEGFGVNVGDNVGGDSLEETGESNVSPCFWDDENNEEEDVELSEHITASVLHTGCDAPMFDLEHCPEDDHGDYAEDERAGSGIIPTTLSGAMPTSFGNSMGTMGTSVLLNKFGTVLVRRENRLQATRRERNLVERVVARDRNSTVPLVYLEGMLFPSIFWSHSGGPNGGLLGCIPTALFCQHETRKRFQIASVAEHAKVRLKHCGSSASTNPYYLAFLFDCLANGALEGHDTRVVLSRGFAESMGPAGMRMRNGEDDFYTDTIDNRQCCHNLCASERDKRSSLFVTLTCNQREHFGVAPVKRYVDSADCLDNYKAYVRKKFGEGFDLSCKEEEEVKFAMQEAARNLIVRNWMEVRVLLIRYLLKSPEKPLGDDVEKIFVRDEYQTESGNLSHLHMLVTLRRDYASAEGRRTMQGLIRGFVDEIVGLDEVEGLISEGILEGWEDYWEMKEQAGRILSHSCDSHRCLRRVGPNRDELVCRVPDTRKLSLDLLSFFEKTIEVEHSSDAIRIYERLGFCERMADNGGVFSPQKDFLKPKRILPPARFGEGNITPVIGRLFAATRSSMNVQICTSLVHRGTSSSMSRR